MLEMHGSKTSRLIEINKLIIFIAIRVSDYLCLSSSILKIDYLLVYQSGTIVTYIYGEHFRTSNIIVTSIPTKRMPKTAPITRATFSSASNIVTK